MPTKAPSVSFVSPLPPLVSSMEDRGAANAPAFDLEAEDRKARALAFLEAHPNVKRACFADVKADPANIVLTVAIREPWGAVEVLVRRERFDALALMDLAARYPATALQVPEH